MSVKCREIIKLLETMAPPRLAEEWDNSGLLIGSPEQDVEKILVVLDVSRRVAEYAADNGIKLIISHHPVIFRKFAHIRTDSEHGYILARLLKADIAVYAAHTNLDMAGDGVNDILARRLNLLNIKPLRKKAAEKLVKLAVYVPESHVDQVRAAVAAAGAGHIGNYSHCTFQVSGTGTFLPLEGTSPYIGTEGVLEHVAEVRMETIMPAEISGQVVQAVLHSHPYEEPAYDLYPLNNAGKPAGLGRVGELAAPVQGEQFVALLKSSLGVQFVRVAGSISSPVRKVAVCGGSGASLVSDAAEAGADVLVTGDVRYHDAAEAVALGLTVIDAGHFATEFPIVGHIAEYIEEKARKFGWNIAVEKDSFSADIFSTV